MSATGPGPDEEREYFASIEAEFIGLRGTPFLLSPKDFALMRAWHTIGVPAEDVVSGIAEAFARRSERGSAARINSLSYCEGAVLEAWERRSSLRAGAGGRASPEPSAEDVFPRLVGELGEAAERDLRIRSACERAIEAIEREKLRSRAPAERDDRLHRIEKRLLKEIGESLPADEISERDRAVSGKLAGEEERMTTDALKRTRGVLERQWVRRRYGLPPLTLGR